MVRVPTIVAEAKAVVRRRIVGAIGAASANHGRVHTHVLDPGHGHTAEQVARVFLVWVSLVVDSIGGKGCGWCRGGRVQDTNSVAANGARSALRRVYISVNQIVLLHVVVCCVMYS